MSRRYGYADAKHQKLGEMRCSVCHVIVRSGLYRHYETPRSYVVTHRSCCESDQHWAILDAQDMQQKKHRADLLSECIAFAKKWQIDDLDDLIDSLR